MTSRVSFYKAMIQDLSHKVWMIALSCLGSFLALPVFYLLQHQDWMDRIDRWDAFNDWSISEYKLEVITGFFKGYMVITEGIILVAGAIIVGIFGFRHVFSKKMVDQYHSIPMTRKELFLINYINGFLIWFVPMFIGSLICAALAAGFLADFSAWTMVMGDWLISMANFIIAFLLVYHVAIAAVMLSGNIINTLISGAILGLGAIAFAGMVEVFSASYFDTYYSFFSDSFIDIIWASPLAAAIYQLVLSSPDAGEVLHVSTVVMNLIMVVAMWFAGLLLYLRRPSELAEQGLKIKPVQMVFKAVSVILAGMCGWMLFDLINNRLPWMVFGAVLAGVLCYGTLDIIFHMDFKAFFANKVQMGVTVLAAVLIGFGFYYDWIGYDTYVPKKEDIQDMGVHINSFGQGSLYSKENIDNMKYTNQDVIYDFLNTATKSMEKRPVESNSARAYVRVTEKSGKTYYRQYQVMDTEEEIVVPILRDESYIENNVLIPQWIIDDADVLKLDRARFETYQDEYDIYSGKDLQKIFEAYNSDMLSNPDLFIYQNEKVLCQIYARNNSGEYYYLRLDVYESMERTISTMKELGYGYVLEEITPEDVEYIILSIYDSGDVRTLEQYLGLEPYIPEERAEVVTDQAIMPVATKEYAEYNAVATIEHKKDIAALLEVLTFLRPDTYSMFSPDFCVFMDVSLKMSNGDTRWASLKSGVFPEELLDQFVMEPTEY